MLQGKITKFFHERVLKPIRHRLRRSGSDLDPDQQSLRELQREIKKEERRLRGVGKGRDRDRRERELLVARQVARAVRDELKTRDTSCGQQAWL